MSLNGYIIFIIFGLLQDCAYLYIVNMILSLTINVSSAILITLQDPKTHFLTVGVYILLGLQLNLVS